MAMRIFVLLLAVSLATSAFAQTATEGDLMPSAQSRHYDPISNHTDQLEGDLTLSTDHARFSKRKGIMDIEFAGTMPENKNFELSGAAVYRVKNAQQYFELNGGANGMCPEPTRWLTIRLIPGASPMIRVGQLFVEDWKQYDPSKLGLCGADTYALSEID
jgi:hypothetical protein